MQAFLALIITLCCISEITSKSCLEVKLQHETDCQISHKENYVECVRTRMKRHSSDCTYDDQCFDCDCESCQYSQCDGECNGCCNACCSNYVQCHTRHCCHKQCHSECRTYNCRSSCRKSCYDSVKENEEVSEVSEKIVDRTILRNGEASNSQTNTSNINAHNITTVINLKNVINNTNVVDVPINVNFTHKNNISLTEGAITQGGSCSGSPNGEGNCCIVIGPRQCSGTVPNIRCVYLRSKQCGSICKSPIIHEEEVPDPACTFNAQGERICQPQTAYIPQPQPRCSYTNKWPYVKCEIQTAVSCDGCYGHYFNNQIKEYKSCPSQCYNDFGAGPLYRQGPFYQPSYSHLPPCSYSPQGCGGYGQMGGFGMMGPRPYGGGMGDYMGGFNPGFGGGFGYGALSPMSQPFIPPQPFPFNPELVGNTTYDQILSNSSETLDGEIIKDAQDDSQIIPDNGRSSKEVEIDVKIIGSNENKLPYMKKNKRHNEILKEEKVIFV